MVKNIVLLLIFFTSLNIAQDNNLVGTWQFHNTKESAGFKDLYRFYNDGKFIFNVSSYRFRDRLGSVVGKYKLEKGYIFFEVYSYSECTNGELDFGGELLDYSWGFKDDKVKYHKLSKPLIFQAGYKVLDQNKKIVIEFMEFYKISNDPNYGSQ